MVRFGPAGNSVSFTQMGYKSCLQLPEYLKIFSLAAFEYQCGRGVRIRQEFARQLGEVCAQADIALSVHAPYYISLASEEEQKRQNSIEYLRQSCKAAKAMGATRIVLHPGSCGQLKRDEAVELARQTLSEAVRVLDEEGYGDIHLCPETMGKVNQLGTLQEVLELCGADERLIPCVDFGHLNARSHGGHTTIEAISGVFDAIEDKLGRDRLKIMHAHFSKIEYTAGGEKKHLTFEDSVYGPPFEPVAEMLAKKGCDGAVIICESDGTQAEDARTMMGIYHNMLEVVQ